MPTFRLFRLSTYLTLITSFIALAYSEWIFVPEATVMLFLMTIALVLLYLYEDRLPLTLRGANRVGFLLGLVTFTWLAWQLSKPGTGLLENLPWSVRIMPYIGPVLAVLVPAKLMRPNKHVGDYWTFHAAALCLVALATAMAEDTIFCLIVMAYLFLFIWSLVIFFTIRSNGGIAPLPTRQWEAIPVTHVGLETPHPRRRELRLVFVTLLASMAIATPFFLITPRTGGPVWDLAGRRFEVGFAADQLLDLNRTGTLHLNTETAFEIEVRDPVSGDPVESLPPEIRWRTIDGAYTVYANGTWRRDQFNLNPYASRRRIFGLPTSPGIWQPPMFGPGTVQIVFSIPTRLRALFLADPMQWNREGTSPVASLDTDGALPWAIRSDGQIIPVLSTKPQRFATSYMQIVNPVSRRDASPALEPAWKSMAPLIAVERAGGRDNAEEYSNQLRLNPVPAVKDYTDDVVRKLVEQGHLPASVITDIDPATQLPHERQHARLAEALRDHLRSSGLFVYSYRLRRQDVRIDPAEDFLKNTREGHCERFATALVLMLRSQGIHTQFVLGFKGVEPLEGGKMIVRQDHAHAWAEALVPVEGDTTGRMYQWLSLDPTPGLEDVDAATTGTWWERSLNFSREMVAEYLVGYDSAARENVLVAIETHLTWTNVAIAVLGIGLFVLALCYWRQRSDRRPRPEQGWDQVYVKLLLALRPLGLQSEPGQTPREFAVVAEARLRSSPQTAALARLPQDWVDAHYADRFGGQKLRAERAAELHRTLNDLRRAIRNGG